MVSTTFITAAPNALPFISGKPPAPTPPKSPSPPFTLSDVTLNAVAPKTVTELIDLGKNRHSSAATSATTTNIEDAFPGDSSLEHDVVYFKALLAARTELRLALQNKIQGLQGLRKRNNRLAKRKHRKNHLAAAAAAAAAAKAKAADSEGGVVANKGKAFADSFEGSFTGSGMRSTSTCVTGLTDDSVGCGKVDRVEEGWRAGEGQISICSSPVSMEEPIVGGGCGGVQQGCEAIMIEKREVSYRV